MKWSIEAIRLEALKYKTKAEFKKGNHSCYQRARSKNMLNDGVTCSHMTAQLNYWNVESIRAEALKYSTRNEFIKGSRNAYSAAFKRKMLDDGITCQHMTAQLNYWNVESIRAEALKYNSKEEFKKGNSKAYAAAQSKGMLVDEITCKHMTCRKKWSIYLIRKEALKFSTRVDFLNNSPSAYQIAFRNNMLNDGITFSHMTAQLNSWDAESISYEALKYKTKSELRRGNLSAYRAAQRKNMLKSDAFEHMIYGHTIFIKNKSAILYYMRLDSKYELPLYKIGITNFTVKKRILDMRNNKEIKITVLKEIWFENGAEAWELEKELHKEFKEYRYYGDAILRNGNTELFVTDVLQYDTQQQAA